MKKLEQKLQKCQNLWHPAAARGLSTNKTRSFQCRPRAASVSVAFCMGIGDVRNPSARHHPDLDRRRAGQAPRHKCPPPASTRSPRRKARTHAHTRGPSFQMLTSSHHQIESPSVTPACTKMLPGHPLPDHRYRRDRLPETDTLTRLQVRCSTTCIFIHAFHGILTLQERWRLLP